METAPSSVLVLNQVSLAATVSQEPFGRSIVSLDLNDRPWLQQIYFADRFFRPQTTEMRLNDLVFVLQWLDGRGISYCWSDLTQLTHVSLAGGFDVAFCYKYHLSRADIDEVADRDDFEESTIKESRREVLNLLGPEFEGMIVDLTVLSQSELSTTRFLDQVSHKVVRIGSDGAS